MMCDNTGLEYTALRKITEDTEMRARIRQKALYRVGKEGREENDVPASECFSGVREGAGAEPGAEDGECTGAGA